MKIEDIKGILEQVGIPVAYHHFKGQTDPPFLVYYLPESRNVAADDCVHQKVYLLRVELYTERKDIDLEEKVEQVLAEMVYKKDETYIESEDMLEIIYEMEVLIE